MTPKTLVSGVIRLLSLPEVYFRLEELMDDPRTSAEDLGKLISHDPGLATRLLKLANSAFYGSPSKIDNLPRAITLIGTKELRDLILATVAVETFNKIASNLVDMSTFWHHSVYCGLAARLLAKRCNVLHAERLFAAGLLHDVGQLVIYHEIPVKASQVLASAEPNDNGLYHAEQQVLGFTHGEVGCELFKAWQLPASFQETAAFHHEPGKAQDYSLEAAIVHLANSTVNAVEPGRNIVECCSVRDAAAWQYSGLSEAILDEVLVEAEAQFLEVIKIISPGVPLL